MWGCCDSDICFNNATTGNQPFCGAGPRCTVSGGTTPAEGAGPMSLCPVNTDCVNITLPTTVRDRSSGWLGAAVQETLPSAEYTKTIVYLGQRHAGGDGLVRQL
jgi:hypothetical protein